MENKNPFEDPFETPRSNNPQQNPNNPPFQQQQQFQQGGPNMMGYGNEPVPNATAVLVLGIISIVGAFCYAVPGLVCAIIAMALQASAYRAYNAEPDRYSQTSFGNLKGGRVCAIIGLSLSILMLIVYVLYFVFIISMASSYSYYDRW